MIKTTRQADLELLEEARDKAETKEGRLHRQALLEAVYEQSKDSLLEKLKNLLIDALKNNDIKKLHEIQKKVEAYAKSPSYLKKIAGKINKNVNEKEAYIYYNRQ